MQKRPSMVYIRRRSCRRRTFRCCIVYFVLLILLLCLNIRLIWSLIWAGILTVMFRLLIIGRYI